MALWYLNVKSKFTHANNGIKFGRFCENKCMAMNSWCLCRPVLSRERALSITADQADWVCRCLLSSGDSVGRDTVPDQRNRACPWTRFLLLPEFYVFCIRLWQIKLNVIQWQLKERANMQKQKASPWGFYCLIKLSIQLGLYHS